LLGMEKDVLTEKIIEYAFKVHNTLGCGFLEKVYENSMMVELKKAGLNVQQQQSMSVKYEGVTVGDYIADLIVNGKVIIEIKSVNNLIKEHEVQLVNYLKATGINIGLLINFGRSVEVRRKYRDPK
jgi:GxxExxY protein